MGEQRPWIDHLQFEKPPKPEKSPKEIKLRKIAKILVGISLPVTILILGGSFQSDWNPFLVYAGVSCLLRFIILWLSLYYPLPGGLILIIDGVVLVVCLSKSYHIIWKELLIVFPSILFSLPVILSLLSLSSGILFLLTWYEHRKNIQSSSK